MQGNNQQGKISTRIASLWLRIKAIANYCSTGVWRSQSNSFGVKLLKTLNLSVRSFLNSDLQNRAQALTYVTVLAVVPALALLVAIGRGFGLSNLITDALYKSFPSQSQVISTGLSFVDSYLGEASQGIFVGIGLLILLWTVISLLSNIEDTFNSIWGLTKNRSFWRKVTDYTAICIFIPILMVCSSGISILVSTSMQSTEELGLHLLTPFVSVLLDILPFVLSCIAFTLAFQLFPNTHVRLKYSCVSGLICGLSFQILQFLFVSGQVYVSKYNAIYGSFAFLPLLLIWLQLSWFILLFGCQLTYSAQNIFHYYFIGDISGVSPRNIREIALVVMTVVIQRYESHREPLSASRISQLYNLPIRVVTLIAQRLIKSGVLFQVTSDVAQDGLIPNVDTATFSISQFMKMWDTQGRNLFIPHFDTLFSDVLYHSEMLCKASSGSPDDIPLVDIKLPTPDDVAAANKS